MLSVSEGHMPIWMPANVKTISVSEDCLVPVGRRIPKRDALASFDATAAKFHWLSHCAHDMRGGGRPAEHLLYRIRQERRFLGEVSPLSGMLEKGKHAARGGDTCIFRAAYEQIIAIEKNFVR